MAEIKSARRQTIKRPRPSWRNAARTALVVVAVVWVFHRGVVPGALAADAGATSQASLAEVLKTFHEKISFLTPTSNGRIIAKWVSPIRLGVVAESGAPMQLLDELVDDLNLLPPDRRSNTFVTTQQVNFLVILTQNLDADVTKYRPMMLGYFGNNGRAFDGFFGLFKSNHWACAGQALINQNDVILGALIVVRVSNTATPKELACVRGGLLAGLGFGEISPGVYAMRLSAEAQSTLPPTLPPVSAADRAALRVLYDKRLQPGMSESETRKTIEKIFADRGSDNHQ